MSSRGANGNCGLVFRQTSQPLTKLTTETCNFGYQKFSSIPSWVMSIPKCLASLKHEPYSFGKALSIFFNKSPLTFLKLH